MLHWATRASILGAAAVIAREPQLTLPAGTPAWITSDLVSRTIFTWQPYYREPLDVEQAIDMILAVGRLTEVMSEPHHETFRCPSTSQQ